MSPGLEGYAASFLGELDRLAGDLRQGSLAEARRSIVELRDAFVRALREIDPENAWTEERATATLCRLQSITRDRLTAPLADAMGELDLGLRLVDLTRDIEMAAHSLSRPGPVDPEADEAELAWQAFRRHVVDELLPGVVREAAHAAAADEIEPFGRLTTALTRWTHAILGLEDELAERERSGPEAREEGATASSTETPAGAGAKRPAADGPPAPDADPSTSGADAAPEDAADEPSPALAARDRVRELYSELAGSLDGLVESLDGAWVTTIARAAGNAVREAAAGFDPEARAWKSAARALRERASGESDASRPTPGDGPAPASWSVEDALIPRFAAETGRVELCHALLEFDRFLSAFPRRHLLAPAFRAAEAVDAQMRSAVGTLRALSEEAEAAFPEEGLLDTGELTRIRRRGRAALAKAEDEIGRTLDDHDPETGVEDGLRALFRYVGSMPETLAISPRVEEGETARVAARPIRLELREWAEEILDGAVLDRLSAAGAAFSATLETAHAVLPQARNVLEYNLGAAAEREELPPDGTRKLQRELLLGGLDRSADRLEEAVDRLGAGGEAALAAPREILGRTARRFRERCRAERSLEGHARDALQSARQGALRTRTLWARRLRRAWESLLELGRRTSKELTRALSRARTAVGASEVEADRADLTARTIADLDAAADALPFVYRRLFGYRPQEDPDLLVGRERESAILDEHLADWEKGNSDAVLLVGAGGVGLSSLLRSTRERWYGRVDWRQVDLDRRIEDEAEWAGLLGRALELEPAPATLADVEERLAALETPAFPLVCAIENLEHVYFRGVLSRGLLAPTIKLLSSTDTNVLWISCLRASTWQVVRATDPGLSALLRVIPVAPLGRPEIEAAILARHDRSGIGLVWEETEALPMVARRALGKAETEEERQSILRSAYFDRLFELSGGYVALALLYWLRSIDPDDDGDRFLVRWPLAIDFGGWDALTADAGFALRAFLEHGTLTLAEYARLFGVSEMIAFATFERLGSLLLIEPVGEGRRLGMPLVFRRIERGERYRIRPVLVRPVERLLEGRRLFY